MEIKEGRLGLVQGHAVAFDFDGVIHKYREGWKDGSIYDEANKEAIEVIDTLLHLMCWEEREDGYKPTMEEMSNSMDLLKELVDKETPKKPIDIEFGPCGDLMLCCPTCKHGVVPIPSYGGNKYYPRCPFCGQKLEGENEDDC